MVTCLQIDFLTMLQQLQYSIIRHLQTYKYTQNVGAGISHAPLLHLSVQAREQWGVEGQRLPVELQIVVKIVVDRYELLGYTVREPF